MHLRHKFGILVLIYVLSLTGTLATSVWCIVVYLHSAYGEFEATFNRQNEIERLSALVRLQRGLVEASAPSPSLSQSYASINAELSKEITRLDKAFRTGPYGDFWSDIQAAQTVKHVAVLNYVATIQTSHTSASSVDKCRTHVERAFEELMVSLAGLIRALSSQRQLNVDRVAATQRRVVSILMINAACGSILCLIGLFYVRRWVTSPVARLREATRHISQGDFSYRVETPSRDELGLLADEVNEMCVTIVSMQTKLVEQERLAGAGEMVTRLAHNIRNPLAGLRGLAETTLQRHRGDEQTAESQQRIIETVDRFEKWLRDLQQSVSPLTLNIQPADIGELINNVEKVLRPMADRREVELEVRVDPAIHRVRIDTMHFEQALVALMTNALQASERGQAVTVQVSSDTHTPWRWCLTVADEGAGIPPELREKIFLPYFTTRPGGSGLGLAMAGKVVKLHGGRLEVESKPGEGSRFTATMPGLITDG